MIEVIGHAHIGGSDVVALNVRDLGVVPSDPVPFSNRFDFSRHIFHVAPAYGVRMADQIWPDKFEGFCIGNSLIGAASVVCRHKRQTIFTVQSKYLTKNISL
jgi:hypothetical protein